MQEYKISADKLKELSDLIYVEYEVDEINVYMGYAEIKLIHFENRNDIKTIMMEAI